MITELRRAKRITDYLPIVVTAQDGVSGKMLAGPFSGRIIDISLNGACLLMTQVMRNTYHVFHSTREHDSSFLQLTVNIPPEIVNFSLSARPVWLDVFRQEEIRAFKMGVEFMTNPEGAQMKRLQKTLKKQQKNRSAWWTSHATSQRV
ncbi:MAG: hypothetical protein GQ559_07670 [Desulfobulbaceae bacterium]|nr:hypothetical protein [Desulfobulbaceae bacterium]